jgi:hypothetical protein
MGGFSEMFGNIFGREKRVNNNEEVLQPNSEKVQTQLQELRKPYTYNEDLIKKPQEDLEIDVPVKIKVPSNHRFNQEQRKEVDTRTQEQRNDDLESSINNLEFEINAKQAFNKRAQEQRNTTFEKEFDRAVETLESEPQSKIQEIQQERFKSHQVYAENLSKLPSNQNPEIRKWNQQIAEKLRPKTEEEKSLDAPANIKFPPNYFQ